AAACHLGGYSGRATYLVSPYLGIAEALGVSLYSDVVPGGAYQSTSNFRGPVVEFTDDGSQFLANIANHDWAQYGPLDFTGKTSIEFRIASVLEGEIGVYLDSLEGQPILTAHVPITGGLDKWQAVSADFSGIAGHHIAFLKFTAAGRERFLRLQSFRLLPANSSEQPAERVVYAPGSTIIDPKNDALFAAAVNAAKESDVALVFVGDNRLLSDEGRDRTFLHLPEVQQDLVKAVVTANPRTVVVVNSDCPVAINWEQEHAPAVLCCFSAGEQQGNAIADALFGEYNPSGKLCSTWYRNEDQLPNFHDYDIKHGRTYMYLRRDPLYPFGHGLSYTTFSYKSLKLSGSHLLPNKAVTLTIEVSNTGRVAGSEIVQFYVQAGGELQRPAKQLAGFHRVDLQSGENQTVTFSLPHDHIALRYWDEGRQQFAYDPGIVGLLIGASSVDIRLQSSVALV
ncbi:MAG: glycoside hydrolase family 3 C-terminal domain-containing protein, partial [Acidobacteriaceae bacterium]